MPLHQSQLTIPNPPPSPIYGACNQNPTMLPASLEIEDFISPSALSHPPLEHIPNSPSAPHNGKHNLKSKKLMAKIMSQINNLQIGEHLASNNIGPSSVQQRASIAPESPSASHVQSSASNEVVSQQTIKSSHTHRILELKKASKDNKSPSM